ncbi:hypothetical protein FRB98_008638 [Tulasnella sp. 332]|nr:hypothetical protein FRB98_008638 [Tulasnella sp. 332]
MVPKAHGEIELGTRFLACALGALHKSYVYPDGPSAYWTDFDSFQVDAGWRMAGDICLAVAAYSGDQLMVWRLYVIWSRNKHVLYIPALAATLGAAGVVSVISYDVLCVRDSAFLPQHRAVSIAVFGITIISTWYSTILICAKIWSVDRERRRLQQSSPSRYGQIIWVMIQSGTLYSLTLGAWLICTLVNDVPSGFIGINHLRLPAYDVQVIYDFYTTIFPFERLRQYDHYTPDHKLFAVMYPHKHTDLVIEIRHVPKQAEAQKVGDPIT